MITQPQVRVAFLMMILADKKAMDGSLQVVNEEDRLFGLNPSELLSKANWERLSE